MDIQTDSPELSRYVKIFTDCLNMEDTTFRTGLKPKIFFQIASRFYVCCHCHKQCECSKGKNKVENEMLTRERAALHLTGCKGRRKARHGTKKVRNIFIFHLESNGTFKIPKMFTEMHGSFDNSKYQAETNALAPPSQISGPANSASVPAGGQSSSSVAPPPSNTTNGPPTGVACQAANQPSDGPRKSSSEEDLSRFDANEHTIWIDSDGDEEDEEEDVEKDEEIMKADIYLPQSDHSYDRGFANNHRIWDQEEDYIFPIIEGLDEEGNVIRQYMPLGWEHLGEEFGEMGETERRERIEDGLLEEEDVLKIRDGQQKQAAHEEPPRKQCKGEEVDRKRKIEEGRVN